MQLLIVFFIAEYVVLVQKSKNIMPLNLQTVSKNALEHMNMCCV